MAETPNPSISAAFAGYEAMRASLGEKAPVVELVRATALLHGYVRLRLERAGMPEELLDSIEAQGGELAEQALALSDRRLGPGTVAEA